MMAQGTVACQQKSRICLFSPS